MRVMGVSLFSFVIGASGLSVPKLILCAVLIAIYAIAVEQTLVLKAYAMAKTDR